MKVALVLHGDPPSTEDLKLLDSCQAIVCADGGAKAILKAERTPSVIVGDMDSLEPDVYNWADALDVPLERHPFDKDEIDGELALERVLEMDPRSVLILGGHGGRTAMFLANLKLLRRCHDHGLEASMVGRDESIRFVSEDNELALAGRGGCGLDIVPIDGKAVVSLSGTRWSGERIELGSRSTQGVSNVITSDGALITVHEGTVLAIVERRETRRRQRES